MVKHHQCPAWAWFSISKNNFFCVEGKIWDQQLCKNQRRCGIPWSEPQRHWGLTSPYLLQNLAFPNANEGCKWIIRALSYSKWWKPAPKSAKCCQVCQTFQLLSLFFSKAAVILSCTQGYILIWYRLSVDWIKDS